MKVRIATEEEIPREDMEEAKIAADCGLVSEVTAKEFGEKIRGTKKTNTLNFSLMHSSKLSANASSPIKHPAARPSVRNSSNA